MRKTWYVYVVRCGDGTLYTGVTTDLARRLAEHASGRGAKYTRSRGGVTLQHWESAPARGAALSREAAIKRLPRAAKLRLADPPGLRPATPADLPWIASTLARYGLDQERLEAPQFFVATEGRSRAGFARIKPYRGCFELSGVAVLERHRRRGVGARIVRALVERFPTPDAWILTERPEWFAGLGFERAEPPRDLRRKLEGT